MAENVDIDSPVSSQPSTGLNLISWVTQDNPHRLTGLYPPICRTDKRNPYGDFVGEEKQYVGRFTDDGGNSFIGPVVMGEGLRLPGNNETGETKRIVESGFDLLLFELRPNIWTEPLCWQNMKSDDTLPNDVYGTEVKDRDGMAIYVGFREDVVIGMVYANKDKDGRMEWVFSTNRKQTFNEFRILCHSNE